MRIIFIIIVTLIILIIIIIIVIVIIIVTAVQKVLSCSSNASKNSNGRVKKCSYKSDGQSVNFSFLIVFLFINYYVFLFWRQIRHSI